MIKVVPFKPKPEVKTRTVDGLLDEVKSRKYTSLVVLGTDSEGDLTLMSSDLVCERVCYDLTLGMKLLI